MISVLLVDDEPPALDSGKRYLEAQGHYKVSTTLSPLTALGMLKTGHYDIIISDYNMPDMDGIGFLKQVRAAYPSLPFILYTSKSRSDIAGEAFDNEADFYLQRTGNPVLVMEELTQKIQLIVERRSMQEALRASEEKFRLIFDKANDAIHVHELTADRLPGRFLDVNEVACSMLQYTKDELLEKGPLDLVTGYHSRPIPQIMEELTLHGHARFETEHRRKDGTIVIVEVNSHSILLLNKPALLSVVRDITERKRAEEELRLHHTELTMQNEELLTIQKDLQVSRDQYMDLYDMAPVGYLTISGQGLVLKANLTAATLLNVEQRKLVKAPVSRFIVTSDQNTYYQHLKQLADTNQQQSFELKIRRQGGSSPIWAQIIMELAPEGEGDAAACNLIILDITDRKRAEQEIARIAHEWEVTFNATSDGICLIDANQKIQRCNNRMGEILGGMRHEDLVDKHCWAIIHKTTGPIPECPFVSAKKTLKRTRVEIPAGDLWFEVTADPVLDSSGKFAGAVHIMRDVTERKRVEEALQKSELRYRNLFNSSRDAMMTLEPPSWKFTSCNPSAVQMFMARDEAEFTSKEPWTLSPDHQPDGRDSPEKAKDMIETAMRNGTHFFEWTHTRLNSEDFPATVLLSKIELTGKVFLQATVRDITEQKRAEETLRETNAYLNNLFDYANAPIITWDPGFHITRFNHAFTQLTGKSQEEVLGKTLDLLFPRETHTASMALIQKAFSGERWETVEIPILAKDGAIRTVLWNSANVLDLNGTIVSTIAQGVDITERKRAEEALLQANKQLNLLSSITRHDILNQLMALKGYLYLSHDVINNPTTLIEYITKEEMVANAIEHQITFTRDYQELGVAASGWQNVNASIHKAVAGLPMRAVHIEPDPADPEVYADPLFDKVFYNLIDNALRYGGDQMKTIRVSSQESDTSLAIVCEDDGVGITVEDKKKLFRKGFGKHTGLGLFLSREILAITGITITENGEPGVGARFEITVPKGMWRMKGVNQ